MADYVLIHGGHKDGSIWEKVAALLEEQEHEVFAPSLPDAGTSTLAEFIAVVCKLFEEEGLEDVILAGHSSGALTITGVADRMPERIAHLVYVDSSVPIDGKSLYGMFEDLGISPAEYDLPMDPPWLEPLHFDAEKIRRIPKTYVFCAQGEFKAVTTPFFEEVKQNAERDSWNYYTLDCGHECMISHAAELAYILLGQLHATVPRL